MLFGNAAGYRAHMCDSHKNRGNHAAVGGKAWDL